MRLISRMLVGTAAVSAAVLAYATGGIGTSSVNDTPEVVTAANEALGYAIEDFNYPQADKILAEQGILLKRGDGHIVLAQCGSEPGLLEVWPRDKAKVCFRVTGNEGYLSLEIPSVYGIKGNEYTTEVTMTVGNEEKSFDVVKNGWTQVGETADPEDRDHMLVEIIATR
ncbi:hypothetical protein [Streptomyces wuyuanensis]|uniref:hypothetical protein n=1 Tax=Streptomyces wuyuanensis TaxID=1196353 RepID=UPI003F541B34